MPTKDEFFETDFIPMIAASYSKRVTTALQSARRTNCRASDRTRRQAYKSLLVRGQPIFDESGKTIEVYGVLIPQRCD